MTVDELDEKHYSLTQERERLVKQYVGDKDKPIVYYKRLEQLKQEIREVESQIQVERDLLDIP